MASKRAERIRLIGGIVLVLAALGWSVYHHWIRKSGPRTYTLALRADGMWRMTGQTMGTIPYRILIWPGELDQKQVIAACDATSEAIERVNRVMSAYLPDSDLSRINAAEANQPMRVDAELFSLLETAREQTALTDGAFDPTARRLFRLWSKAGKTDQLPSDEQIAAAEAMIGWDKVVLDPQVKTVSKAVEGLQIDLGAIAKGYAVDKAAETLIEAGAVAVMVEIGGEIRLAGKPAGSLWTIGIQHPFLLQTADGKPALAGTLTLTDQSVATSGNYRRFSTIQGKRYSHIIDPRTGRPVDTAPSVTVIAPDCMTADAWATSLSVLGEKGLDLVESTDGIEALLILGGPADARVVRSSGFAKAESTPVRFE